MSAAASTGAAVWITGLGAVGKTTLATALVARLRARALPTVLLDGDMLRAVFEHDLGYALDERRRCARRYAHLGEMLAAQGLHVVVATISMFEDVRRWNRAHLPRYLEVYVRAPAAVRRRRAACTGPGRDTEPSNVVGDDLPFEEPCTPDLVLDNDGSRTLDEVGAHLWTRVREHLGLVRD
jgi:adenylylsulfate kinase-like enzyme